VLPTSLWARCVATALLIALVALSWSRALDTAASEATTATFKRALAIAAIARTFNGVISVAQGTEIAVQPIGVGVTVTVGEILDPLNDLVERFSMLALVASVSLGVQITLTDILSTVWLSGFMTAAILTYVVLMWRMPENQAARTALRISGTVIFARFLLAVAMLVTHWLNVAFLQERQDQAVEQISATTAAIEELQNERTQVDTSGIEDSFLDRTAARIDELLDSSRQALDLDRQLDEISQQIEGSVEELIYLIVIFLLQTLVLPFAALFASWWGLKQFWRWTGSSS
jgi:hypothetical protein